LQALQGGGDDQDAAQRFHFTACFALDGDEEAKRAMYEHYHPGPRMGELIGVDLVRMDGMEGLLFVAEKIGALMMEKPEQVDEGLLFFHSTEILGEEAFLNRWRGPAPRALVLGSTGPWPSSGTNDRVDQAITPISPRCPTLNC